MRLLIITPDKIKNAIHVSEGSHNQATVVTNQSYIDVMCIDKFAREEYLQMMRGRRYDQILIPSMLKNRGILFTKMIEALSGTVQHRSERITYIENEDLY